MGNPLLATLGLIERLHRQCLEIAKIELEHRSIRDLTNVQAVMLFNIGEEELSVGELIQRGYYLGSNASYNVKQMTKNGYLIQKQCSHDRRLHFVRASETGLEIHHALNALFDRHANQGLREVQITQIDLNTTNEALQQLHRYWSQ